MLKDLSESVFIICAVKGTTNNAHTASGDNFDYGVYFCNMDCISAENARM